MAKAAITKKTSLSATGILSIDNDIIGIENSDTGELIEFNKLLADFSDKYIKLSVTYDYDYENNVD